jgi:hypothetical protein
MVDIPVFGINSLQSGAMVNAGAGTGTAIIGGTLSVNTTAVGTGNDTDETTLMSYSLPANTLNTDGRGIRITAVLKTSADANNKTIQLKFGSAVINSTGAITLNDERMVFTASIYRTGAGGQDAWFERLYNGGQFVGVSSPTQDETTALTVAVLGTNAVATVNGIVCEALIVEFMN